MNVLSRVSRPANLSFLFILLCMVTGVQCSTPVGTDTGGITVGDGSTGFGQQGFGAASSGGGVPGVATIQSSTSQDAEGAFDHSSEDASFEVVQDVEDNPYVENANNTSGDQESDFDDDAYTETNWEDTYECEIGAEEECVTECGSIGSMVCSKNWGPCIPPDEICNDADDDCDGLVDEDLVNLCGGCGITPSEVCNGFDDDCDGLVDEGLTNACGLCGPVPQEVCNGIDDNCDGQVDEGVKNSCGACGPTNAQELCNGLDDDCDGQVDEECYCEINVNLNGDCLTVSCPSECPYPIGCDVDFKGGDPRGCIASQSNKKEVYFQEGNNCGAGSVSGVLLCSSVQKSGLNQSNCTMNKPDKYYVSNSNQCPETD